MGLGYWKDAMKNTPKEVLNYNLAYAVLCFGLMVSRSHIIHSSFTEADHAGNGSWTR